MRRSLLALTLLASCAAAGCTTVSAPPPAPPVPGPAAPHRPGRGPDDTTALPQPPAAVLAPAGTAPATGPPAAPGKRPGTPSPPYRGSHPPRSVPHPPGHRASAPRIGGPLSGTASLCDLGEEYGGWAGGSDAATICHQAYGG